MDIQSQILAGSGLRGGYNDDPDEGLDYGGDTNELTPRSGGNIWGD